MTDLAPAAYDAALAAVAPADAAAVFASVTTTAVGAPVLASSTFPPTTAAPTRKPTHSADCGVDEYAPRSSAKCEPCGRFQTTNEEEGESQCRYASLRRETIFGFEVRWWAYALCVLLVAAPAGGLVCGLLEPWFAVR